MNIHFNMANLRQVALVERLVAIVVDGVKIVFGHISEQNVKDSSLDNLFSHISEISMVSDIHLPIVSLL